MLINRIKNRISEAATEACGYSPLTKVVSEEEINRILEQESGWIPCSERLPEERDSMFARFKGTKKWSPYMFMKVSDDVIVAVENGIGQAVTTYAHTTDGKWECDLVKINGYRVIAWMPLPEPYSADTEKPQTNADRIRSMTDEELAEWFDTVTKDVLGGSTWNKKGWLKWLRAESEE